MRALAVFLLLATPAAAADTVWTPAPVPSVLPADSVTPAARAGESNGPAHDAPFSGQPIGTATTGGAVSSNSTLDVGTPSVER